MKNFKLNVHTLIRRGQPRRFESVDRDLQVECHGIWQSTAAGINQQQCTYRCGPCCQCRHQIELKFSKNEERKKPALVKNTN